MEGTTAKAATKCDCCCIAGGLARLSVSGHDCICALAPPPHNNVAKGLCLVDCTKQPTVLYCMYTLGDKTFGPHFPINVPDMKSDDSGGAY